ncbi:MAG: NAD(P)H-hydrate dehydratase [Pseudomonadota bacterium]
MELLTAAQMRAIEQAAIESGQVTGLELMERAGRGVVDAILAEWPALAEAPHRAVVLCGPGNNGGDGFVVARLLKDWGWEVEVFLYGDPEKLPPDAKTNYELWCDRGVVEALSRYKVRCGDRTYSTVIVDALFGTGLSRLIDDALCKTLREIGIELCSLTVQKPVQLVAIDIPSGLDADSGRVLMTPGRTGPSVLITASDAEFTEEEVKEITAPRLVPETPLHADLTVSFHRFKLGHFLGNGPKYCGKLALVDIGLGPQPWRLEETRFVSEPVGPRWLRGKHEHPAGIPSEHKFDHGHALVLSGPMGRSGAARLAARAALRVGAGLVTVGAPGSAMMECACQLTAIMLRRAEDADGLAELLQDARMNSICIGPGLGLERARDLVPVVLATGRPALLDADALSAYADRPDALFEMLHGRVVMTPHAGEFARLFPDLAQKLADPVDVGPAYSKLDATHAAAIRAGAVVLLKGPDTVIASPDGRASVHAATYDRAAPWLATAGSGDVLAGLIAGLLARGLDPHTAAASAAWLHVEAARQFGPGLIAEDLPDLMPVVISNLADSC